jgi:hypothetical protein
MRACHLDGRELARVNVAPDKLVNAALGPRPWLARG